MNRRVVEVLAGILEPAEREAVLGDLEETGKSGFQAAVDLLGLVVRRLALPWRRPGTWLVFLVAVVPLATLISISAGRVVDRFAFQLWKYSNDVRRNVGAFDLAFYALELACFAWASGVVIGGLSRRGARRNAVLLIFATVAGTVAYGRPFLPATSTTFALLSLIAELVLQVALVVVPSFMGVRAGATGGRMLWWAAELSVAWLAVAQDFGVPHVKPPFFQFRIVVLAGYCALWPIAYWTATRFLKRRATV